MAAKSQRPAVGQAPPTSSSSSSSASTPMAGAVADTSNAFAQQQMGTGKGELGSGCPTTDDPFTMGGGPGTAGVGGIL